MSPIISLQNLTKHYGDHTPPILSHVNLQINPGRIIAITGPSGSGKTTLLQIIGGLDPHFTGTAIVDGLDLSTATDKTLTHFRLVTIGFVFQSFYLQPFLTVAKNIEIACMPAKLPKSIRQSRINSITTLLGLTDKLHTYPAELSGGQIQRAAIARAAVNHPHIILADEPTGNLDAANTAKIMQLFAITRASLGATIIIATHDPEVYKHADQIIHLTNGAIS
jgi:ABC-type lipoprotein export system ATPase subunit